MSHSRFTEVADADGAQVGVLPRVGNDLNVEAPMIHARHRQADPVHGDRSLADDRRRQRRRILDGQPPRVPFAPDLVDAPGGVDVSLDEMSAKARIDP